MEPMLLGSPVSPATSGLGSTAGSVGAGSAAPFLPSFLFGDTHHSVSTRVPVPGSSPGGIRQHYVSSGQVSPSSPLSSKETLPPNYNTARFGRNTLGGSDRPSGPPVQGLGVFPAALTPTLQHKLHSPFPDHLHRMARTPLGSPHTPLHTQHTAHTPYHTGHDTPINSSIISAEVHGEACSSNVLSDEWVTVFGFPVASASFILTQFAQLGTLTDQRLPGSGNWMHVRYQTPLQARRALSLNGKVFSGNIMVGVMPCTDKAVVRDAANKENQRMLSSSSVLSSAVNTSVGTPAGDAYSTPKANIRSLTHAYSTTPVENQVVPASNTPKKNDSFMSKAMQHLLGV